MVEVEVMGWEVDVEWGMGSEGDGRDGRDGERWDRRGSWTCVLERF